MRAAALLLDAITTTSVHATITYPGHDDVLVTFQACEPEPWTCTDHGASHGPTCSHTRATEYAMRAHHLLNPIEGEHP